MLIIPAIDLRNGHCVRLAQGRASDMRIYDDDPVGMAERFANSGARLIHVVDLDGAFAGQKSPNREIVYKMTKQLGIPIQFGGGIRSVDEVEALLEAGVSRVVLGTLATESRDKLKEFVDRFGEAVAIGIDARAGCVMSRGWEAETELTALDLASSVAEIGARRIIYTDIARDGMLTGPNIQQTIEVARAAKVPITASGGVGSLEDLQALGAAKEPLIDSVIVGRALYEGRFTLEEANAAARCGGVSSQGAG